MKVIPHFTEAKVSKSGFLNKEDLKKMLKNGLVFFVPVVLLYGAQLTGAMTDHTILKLTDFIPSSFVIGAFEAHIIGTVLDYLKKLNQSK